MRRIILFAGLLLLHLMAHSMKVAKQTLPSSHFFPPIRHYTTASGLNQMQMNRQIGLTFARALRCYLRMDPDIILVGEIRDEETAGIAVEAGDFGVGMPAIPRHRSWCAWFQERRWLPPGSRSGTASSRSTASPYAIRTRCSGGWRRLATRSRCPSNAAGGSSNCRSTRLDERL